MNLAVCGCSFSAVSILPEYSGTHWSEILSKKLNANLTNYARGGVSNNIIRLQIDEAIKNKHDLILINNTSPDRIEVTNPYWPEKILEYNAKDGLKNFNSYQNKNYAKFISSTITGFLDNLQNRMKIKKIAVEGYATFIYEREWKSQIDQWVLFNGLYKLHNLNIPFFYNGWKNSKECENWSNEFSKDFIEKHFLPKDFDYENFSKLFENYRDDPGYHTTIESQEKIANLYYEFIKERL